MIDIFKGNFSKGDKNNDMTKNYIKTKTHETKETYEYNVCVCVF